MKGVVHSFSATTTELQGVLERGFYVGLNGIMTFTKDKNQLEAAKKVPLNSMLLETDAPYLPPQQYRGKTCEPWMISQTAQYLQAEMGRDLEQINENTLQAFPRLKIIEN